MKVDRGVESELTARLYGQVAVGQLEDLMSATQSESEAYARHFRVTGRTCSLLMLETEQDYQRFNIKPKDDALLVKTSSAGAIVGQTLAELDGRLQDPKAQTEAWLDRLEKLSGFEFEMPPALGLAIKQMPTESFDVAVPRLVCTSQSREELSKKFFEVLNQQQLDYDAITAEANRRDEKFGAADALKVLSSLIENNPGDTVLTSDVAFSAVEWGLGGQAYPLLKRVADARPYLPHTYQAIGHCLAELGQADLAMIYYEVAMNGQWNPRYQDVARIVGVEYLHLLKRIAAQELTTSVPRYAEARLESLSDSLGIGNPDLIVTMMWNTDRTDVDLHVLEPSGQECYYKQPNIRGGGKITRDVTEGFGPEMYLLPTGQHGKYVVKANFYGSDANRTTARTKVYVTVYESFGTKRESVSRKTVILSRSKEKRDLTTVMVEK